MKALPLRLHPGQDLRHAIEAALVEHDCAAAFVLSGIGSLVDARLRFAAAPEPVLIAGPTEVVSLAGSVAGNGSHLHAVLADPSGRVCGGHVPYGCSVRTTAEVLLALLPGWRFSRIVDAVTGFEELAIARTDGTRVAAEPDRDSSAD